MANTRDVMGESACLDALVAGTLTSFEDDEVMKVGDYCLYRNGGIVTVSLPNAVSIGEMAFYDCDSLQEVNAQATVTIGRNAFENCARLERVTLGNVSTVSQYAFSGCSNLMEINLGKPATISAYSFDKCASLSAETLDLSSVRTVMNYAFRDSGVGKLVLPECTSFRTEAASGSRTSIIDIGGKTTSIYNAAFRGSSSLCHLVMRGVASVVSFQSSSFSNTPISSGLGWVYVPDDLVESYKSDSNWSSMAAQIVGVSEYPKAMQDETISDSWSTIVASSTYATDYQIGSIKYLDVGGTQLAMVLVATDSDDLASGGKARMTWISRDVLGTFGMNYTNSTVGGWASCEMRSWLRKVIYPQVDPTVRSAIKEVTKTYEDSDHNTQSTVDTVWIPSAREVFGGAHESSGCDYTSVFSSVSDKVKKLGIAGSAGIWWLRSAYSGAIFRSVDNSGILNGNNASLAYGVVLGFCI